MKLDKIKLMMYVSPIIEKTDGHCSMIKVKHQQLFDILKEEICHGKWPRGTKLPQLKELASAYSVSINVASKAVELLKEAGLVKVKVGDGIYSVSNGEHAAQKIQFAGKRIFGHYRSAKTLRVLIEGNLPGQLQFWHRFMESFSTENPDVELSVSFCKADDIPDESDFEIVLGGCGFVRNVMKQNDIPNILPEVAADFYPSLYNGSLVLPADFSGLLPYGLNTPCLLALPDTPAPCSGENVLEYIERLPGNPGGYVLRSCHMFLSAMGVPYGKLGTDAFSSADAAAMLEVFEHARELYRAGKLLWHHGEITDHNRLPEMLQKRMIRVFETDSGICQEYLKNGGNILLPHPAGDKNLLFAYCGCISRRTLFPEECLRLVAGLLELRSQKKAAEQKIFCPVLRQLEPGLFGEINSAFDRKKVDLILSGGPDDAVKYQRLFLGWEFFYFLTGKRGKEVVELLDKKIRYYYKNRETGGN